MNFSNIVKVDLRKYNLSPEHLDNLASEFYGKVLDHQPTGGFGQDDFIYEVEFPQIEPNDNAVQFFNALITFIKP
jgi:hypothetical protein